jgi:hypothetical protein
MISWFDSVGSVSEIDVSWARVLQVVSYSEQRIFSSVEVVRKV